MEKGFTLIEAMVTIVILAIMLLFAVPAYQNMEVKAKLRTEISQWQESFYFAQKEALRLQKKVFLCPSDDGASCSASDLNDYSIGWIVKPEGGSVLLDYVPNKNVTLQLSGNVSEFVFLPNGMFKGIDSESTQLTASYEEESEVEILTINRMGRLLK